MGPSRGTLGPQGPLELSGSLGPPGSLGTLGRPGLQDLQYLRISWNPGTTKAYGHLVPLGPQGLRTLGKLPLSFAF